MIPEVREDVKDVYEQVAYPSLRVDVQHIKRQRVRGLPPRRLGPLSIQTSHLNIHRLSDSHVQLSTKAAPVIQTH